VTTTVARAIAEKAVRFGAQQKVRELTQFLDMLIVAEPEVIVEIGVAEGATLWAWEQIAPTVIGIDNGDYTITAPTNAQVIVGDSHQPGTFATLLYRLADVPPEPIDCLFIDGDHSYTGVRQDYENYRELVRPGGLIAFHDIVSVSRDPGYTLDVPKFWAEVRDESAIEIVDSERGSGGRWGDEWGGIGVIRD
jgi:predicted O-methyltransferase YrrM